MTRQSATARRAEELLGVPVVATAPVAGGDICTATRLKLSDGHSVLMKTLSPLAGGLLRRRGPRAALARRGRGGRRTRGPGGRPGLPDPAVDRARQAHPRRGRRVRPGAVPAARGRRGRVRRPARRLHRPAAAAQRHRPHLGRVLRHPSGAAVPQARPGPRRRHRPAGGGRRVGRRAPRRPGPAGAAGPAARRPLERQRAVGPRRRGADDRPGRARRPPRDRPGDARAVRAAAPASGRSTRTTTPPRWWPAGRSGSGCTSCSRCSCTRRCSAAGTAPGPPRWPDATDAASQR